MKSNLIKSLAFLAVAIFFTVNAHAQCKSIVKKSLPKLAPFTHNGQLNAVSLPEGGVADFKISCYKGLNYRLSLASEEVLGKVYFRVMDEDNNEVYNSKDAGTTNWDFNVASSQDLTVEVTVPLTEKSIKGCVALMVGFKQAQTSGIRPM